MKIVSIKNKILFSIFFIGIGLIGCTQQNIEYQNHYCDFKDDGKLDTLLVSLGKKRYSINVVENKKVNLLLKIKPLLNEEDFLKKPSVENVYIECNAIQSNKKGIRIKIRNTDLKPDYFCIDLMKKEKEWIVVRLLIINTNEDIYICQKYINKNIKTVFGQGLVCDISSIITMYFEGRYDCS